MGVEYHDRVKDHRKAQRRRERAARRRYGRHEIQQQPRDLPGAPPSGKRTRSLETYDRWVQHPGFGVEPEAIVSMYREAESGYPARQCDLFDDVLEADAHLRSLTVARTGAVAGKEWMIQPGGDGAADIAAAELLGASLRETNFDDLVGHLLSGRYYGYAGAELVWARVDSDVVIRWFVNVPARRFRFDEADRPLLVNDELLVDGEPLEPGRWIFARNEGAITARSGLLRTATWMSTFKRWSIRDWVIYAEKFGIPLTLGKYDPDRDSDNEKAALEDAIRDMGEAGGAVISKFSEFEVLTETARSGGSEQLHRAIVHECNSEMSKLITGSTLTVESGGPGSFALGQVHETRAFDLVVGDAAWVARRFDADIARPFLAFNRFPAGTARPRLKIHLTRDMDPLSRAQLAKAAQEMGLSLDSEQLRQEFQFRAPPTPERELKRAEPNDATPDEPDESE